MTRLFLHLARLCAREPDAITDDAEASRLLAVAEALWMATAESAPIATRQSLRSCRYGKRDGTRVSARLLEMAFGA